MDRSELRAGRELDLVVFGATGYTGRLVARAVLARAPAGLRIAFAGRDLPRLEALRRKLRADRAHLLVVDADDAASLRTMARRTRAIATTVGPYGRHGTPLVAACVEAGTDVADLAAEPLWMRETIDRFHEPARRAGARIVHACGFDAVPADLGTLVLQEAALRRHGRACDEVLHAVGPLRGGASGGTIASAFDVLARAAADPAARRALADPDLLAPGGLPSARVPDPWWPRRHEDLPGWTAPFPMVVANAKVVRRTRALLGEPWGAGFRYHERLRAPTWARAAAAGGGLRVGTALLAVGPLRTLLRRLLPKPGRGPDERARRRGYFRSTLIGRIDGVREPMAATVAADLDPGYGAASRMLTEVALGLATDDFDARGGVLTPAVAGGRRLAARLGEVGIRVRVDEVAEA